MVDMDKFIFGLVWSGLIALFAGICIYFGNIETGLLLVFLAFFAIGLWVMYLGIKDLSKNRKTNKYGEICYGIIKSIDAATSSVEVNGRCQYKATVEFYFPPMNTTMSLSELYGYKMYKHYVGECVKVKYYNNDINIIEGNIDINTLPYNIQDCLKGVQQNNSVPDGLYTGNENEIVINGVRYVREDNNNQSTF
jgi:hypothetical protein